MKIYKLKANYRYDIARDIEKPAKQIDWVIKRIENYYMTDLTKAGKTRMKKHLSDLKKIKRLSKSLARMIRTNK